MKGRAIIPLVIGLGVGLLAIKLGFDYISKAKGDAVNTDVVEVITCRTDIPMAMKISRDMLSTAKVPKVLLPAQYIEAKSIDKVVDRVTGVMISKGSPLILTSLAPAGTPPGLVVRIPPGYRAIAVKVAEEQQAGGWLVPGSRVDVSAVFQVKSSGSNKVTTMTKVILENIEVAAVGQMMGSESKEPGANVVKSVTLLVKPEDVPKLHFAQTKGKVTFAVRSQTDTNSTDEVVLNEDKFLGNSPDDKLTSAGEGRKTPTSAPASDATGGSFLNGLLGAMMSKAVANVEPAKVQEEPASLPPFRVLEINGGQEKEKVYVNQWSRVELSEPGSGGKAHKGRPGTSTPAQVLPTPQAQPAQPVPGQPGVGLEQAPAVDQPAAATGDETLMEEGE
jgi:Flp pilus assembly protein CpaB